MKKNIFVAGLHSFLAIVPALTGIPSVAAPRRLPCSLLTTCAIFKKAKQMFIKWRRLKWSTL